MLVNIPYMDPMGMVSMVLGCLNFQKGMHFFCTFLAHAKLIFWHPKFPRHGGFRPGYAWLHFSNIHKPMRQNMWMMVLNQFLLPEHRGSIVVPPHVRKFATSKFQWFSLRLGSWFSGVSHVFVHQLAKASGSKRWMASLFSRTMSNVFGRGIYVMFEKKTEITGFLARASNASFVFWFCAEVWNDKAGYGQDLGL